MTEHAIIKFEADLTSDAPGSTRGTMSVYLKYNDLVACDLKSEFNEDTDFELKLDEMVLALRKAASELKSAGGNTP